MAAPVPQQRRRTQKPSTSPPTLPSSPRLRKVGTAHAKSAALNDMINVATDNSFIPKRSITSSRALEALVRQPRSHIVALLEKTDQVLAGLSHAQDFVKEEVWAVPSVLLEHIAVSDEDLMDVDVKKPVAVNHHHASDSGIGSSISTAPSSIGSSGAAINHSFTSAADSALNNARPLSDLAAKEIKTHVLDPLLSQDALSDFYPLLRDVPRRIGTKEIRNLRDLEKNLLLLAYDIAPSAKSYEQFCSQAITCILATVNELPEEDRQLPADRPFTNSYALDLIDQIRRYAQIMAETRAREAEGKAATAQDYSPDEQLVVDGGYSYNGKPAQLLRKKANGETIPLATNEELDAVAGKASSMKRAFEDDDEELYDSDAVRSMARRRKSDRPGDVEHKCNDCDKTFKRPCDLTKHEKTHSRPWKCPDASCRYHKEGWPTEKERERHVNDRHTATPKMFKCLWEGCAYTSKRESNCKQHMEKSHGYVYKRSKANGRAPRNTSSGTASAPLTPFTPISNNFATPITPLMPSPAIPNYNDFGTAMHYQLTPSMAPYDYPNIDTRRQSNATANSSALTFSTNQQSPYESSVEQVITPEETFLDPSALLANMQMNISMNMGNPSFDAAQLFVHDQTPLFGQPSATAAVSLPDYDFSAPLTRPELNITDVGMGHHDPLLISPLGHSEVMLLSQAQLPEDGYMDEFTSAGDFTLYPPTSNDLPGGSMFSDNSLGHDGLFPDNDFNMDHLVNM